MDGSSVDSRPERRARPGAPAGAGAETAAARGGGSAASGSGSSSSPAVVSAGLSVSFATPAPPARRRKRLGVMGGTFDPIHHGHLVAASEVASLFSLDEVVFVPTGRPWQKSERAVTEPEDRYLMTVIATASNPRFSVSRVDIDRGGPTYTVDTLRDLRLERGPDVDFFFITGADALGQIFSWRDADELVELAHFVGCTRPGHTLADPGLPLGKASLVEIPALAISSTACRERVRRGEPVWYLVPDGIVQYINKRGLYQPAEEAT